MNSFVKSKKKKKKTLIILALLNPILGIGILGIHHWYAGSSKKTLLNILITMAYAIFVFLNEFNVSQTNYGSDGGFYEPSPSGGFPLALLLVYIAPTIFELIMIALFPNSSYYGEIEWIQE